MLFDYDFRNYSFRLLAYMTALSVIGILVVRSATNMDSEAVTNRCLAYWLAWLLLFVFHW